MKRPVVINMYIDRIVKLEKLDEKSLKNAWDKTKKQSECIRKAAAKGNHTRAKILEKVL